MPTVKNKTVSFEINHEGTLLKPSYALLIKIVMQTVPIGRTIAEMRTANKTMDILEHVISTDMEEFEIDKEKLNFIITQVCNFRWGVHHNDLIVFEDDLIAASK
jgi:hypothetical protein